VFTARYALSPYTWNRLRFVFKGLIIFVHFTNISLNSRHHFVGQIVCALSPVLCPECLNLMV
jgi:hypothetical protein